MNFVLVMNFLQLLIKLFILVCIKKEKIYNFFYFLLFLDWRVDGDPEHEIGGANPRVAEGALTMIESKVGNIHRNLESCIDYQTHHRLREATGRARAEDLQERVQIWSLGQFILIIIVAIGTVLLLRSFFTDRRTSSSTSWTK